jgi:hypothetical protein
MRKCGFDDIDKALLELFKVQRNVVSQSTGPILMIQAKKKSMQLERKDYNCSNGRLDRFKNRHAIVNGEALSADAKTASEWVKSVWEECMKGYTEEIFYADETGLFYNITPDTTFEFKGEK